VINRRERSKFTPSDVSEVRRRFDRILRRATENAEAAARQHVPVLKTAVPSVMLRRPPGAARGRSA